ncbi:MAG: Gfo/Idh/MocA family protein, partial [Actinomycetota bacterium]
QPGVQVVAACDVDRLHVEEAAKAVGPRVETYGGFRELLVRKDIDAVVIDTPDHWHAAIAIAAMKSGKDVYCERRLTLFIEEGRKLSDTQKRTKRVFQTGSQQRSDARFRLACEVVRNGRLGKLKRVEARLPNGSKGGPFPTAPVPSDLNWDMWLGPAPWTEYIPERTHGNFRHWYEYSGGMMTDWGAHHLDITQWALGMDDSGPLRVEGRGILPANPQGYNTPLDFEITYTYPNDVTVLAMSSGENGVRFEGENGWLFVSRSRIEASDERFLKEPFSGNDVRLYDSPNHQKNFIECIRSRKDPICTAEIGHRSATVCHLGNISLRMGGRRMDWDAKAERFTNDDEANKLVSRPYRKPWKL